MLLSWVLRGEIIPRLIKALRDLHSYKAASQYYRKPEPTMIVLVSCITTYIVPSHLPTTLDSKAPQGLIHYKVRKVIDLLPRQ